MNPDQPRICQYMPGPAKGGRQYSDDPSSENGGDLGFFGAAQMAPAFETAAFALRPGQVSVVVTTQFGYDLIKVYDRKPAGKESFEEAGPRLRAHFQSERMNATLRELVDRLKSEAEIQRFDLEPASYWNRYLSGVSQKTA